MNNDGTFLYTNWSETVYAAPTNPGWHDTFQIYFDGPSSYNYRIDYNAKQGTPGVINPNYNPLISQNKQCFVKVGGSYLQGNLVSYDYSSINSKPNNAPIDDYLPVLIAVLGIAGFFFISKQPHLNVSIF